MTTVLLFGCFTSVVLLFGVVTVVVLLLGGFTLVLLLVGAVVPFVWGKNPYAVLFTLLPVSVTKILFTPPFFEDFLLPVKLTSPVSLAFLLVALLAFLLVLPPFFAPPPFEPNILCRRCHMGSNTASKYPSVLLSLPRRLGDSPDVNPLRKSPANQPKKTNLAFMILLSHQGIAPEVNNDG
jgi:hypothetical protein